MPGGRSEWYDQAFGADYRLVYAHRDLAEARGDVARLRELGLAAPFVDLGCGGGRHLLAAAELGLHGVGVDRSAAQLASVPRGRARIVRGDLRQLPLADASFAWALSLFSSFGYFDDSGDRQQLAEARRVLRPGGTLLLDVADANTVRAGLVPESRRQVGEWTVLERRWLEEDGRRVRKRVRLEGPTGPSRGWTEDLRLYEAAELEALLASEGLEVEARWQGLCSPGGAPEHAERPTSPRQVLLARRR